MVDHLTKNEKLNKSFVTFPKPDDKKVKRSELDYTLKGKGDRYSFIEVEPKTGRHHQIRVQLANMGSIIKGDLKYGAPRPNKDASIHLRKKRGLNSLFIPNIS